MSRPSNPAFPIEARQAAWARLWERLLAEPPAPPPAPDEREPAEAVPPDDEEGA